MLEAIDYDLEKREKKEAEYEKAYDEYCCCILDFIDELNAKFGDFDFDFKEIVKEL